MGNRQTRSAGKKRVTHNSDGVKSSAVTSSTGARHQQQQVSGQTAVDGGRQLQVNIYRSYSQVGNGPPPRQFKPAAVTPDFKVYRRSARPHNVTAASRSMSLPRSFGRTQRLGDQSDVSTMPRLKSDNTRLIPRSSSRASNISSTSCKGVSINYHLSITAHNHLAAPNHRTGVGDHCEDNNQC